MDIVFVLLFILFLGILLSRILDWSFFLLGGICLS